ncbi:MAG: cupin domain-containing protein, partial [Flavobacteriia bacterium]
MNPLFIKTVKANRIAPEEHESIGRSLDALEHSIKNKLVPNALELLPSVNSLYVYSLGSEDQTKEVLEFISWYRNPEDDYNGSERLNKIVSGFFGELQLGRIGEMLDRISLQRSLTDVNDAGELVSRLNDNALKGLYNNKVDALNIDFSVSLLPFDMEVLDPRIVTVQPGKANEMHRHAHETVFIFLKGKGKVLVDDFENEVNPGDFAFIPRWCNHQSVNTGTEELVFLAV